MRTFTKTIGTQRRRLCAIAMVAVIGLSFASCGGGGGGGRAAPASDFSYDLTEDGAGIVITGYTGEGGALVIPATIEDMPVTEIGDIAFRGAFGNNAPDNKDAITSVVIPDSVVAIGAGAFESIDELTKVTLPDTLKAVGGFADCPKLTSVNLPASLEVITFAAFLGCGELSDLVIPDSITSLKWVNIVGNAATFFEGCGKLPIKTRQRLQELGYTGNF